MSKDATDLKTIEDQLLSLRRMVSYQTRDYALEYVIQLFRAEILYKGPILKKDPLFHRRCFDKHVFIESLLLGLPVPFIVCAADDQGHYEILDGLHRLEIASAYMADAFALSGLKLLSNLNGFVYSDLPQTVRQRIEQQTVRVALVDESCSFELRQAISFRLNDIDEDVLADMPRLFALK